MKVIWKNKNFQTRTRSQTYDLWLYWMHADEFLADEQGMTKYNGHINAYEKIKYNAR